MTLHFNWDLKFWETGEYQVVDELMSYTGRKLNPSKSQVFAALKATPYDRLRAVIVGQDPYPDHKLATGLAFSIPPEIETFPPSLKIILDEYSSDLGLPAPSNGDLSKWANEGVLLWNAIPSCEEGKSLSHDCDEWRMLTEEILRKSTQKPTVVVLCGSLARSFLPICLESGNSSVIETAHPSPRGNLFSKTPFTGSKVFSRTNDELVKLGLEPIDWRLSDVSKTDA